LYYYHRVDTSAGKLLVTNVIKGYYHRVDTLAGKLLVTEVITRKILNQRFLVV